MYCPRFPSASNASCAGYWSSVYVEAGGGCAVRCCSSVIAAGNSGLLMYCTWGTRMRELSDGGSCYVSIYGVGLKGYVSGQS